MAADTYASLSDLRVAAILHQELLQLLHDPTDIRQTMVEIPFAAGMGSAATKLGLYQPIDAFAAPGEDTALTVTNITDASATLTLARYGLQREITDLAVLTGGPNPEVLAADMVASATYTLAGMLTTLYASLATSVGTSGVNLSVDNIYAAQYALQASLVTGPFYCVLHPVQWNDFQESLRSEGGASQFSQATNDQLSIKGPGFKGVWNGIEFYVHSTCPTANGGADRVGAMYGKGCFAYQEAPQDRVAKFMNVPGFVAGSKIAVEFQRGSTGATKGKTFMIGQYDPAVVEVEDLRGCKIVTDA